MRTGGRSAASGAATRTSPDGRMDDIESPVRRSQITTAMPIPIPDRATTISDSVHMSDTLTITDNRTGKQYEIPIADGVIRATDLRQLKVASDDQGLATYDPAFMNTAACRSRITYIDGDKGILEYRGY